MRSGEMVCSFCPGSVDVSLNTAMQRVQEGIGSDFVFRQAPMRNHEKRWVDF